VQLNQNAALLPKLQKQKAAIDLLLRACKKDDFMLLATDHCNEIRICGVPEVLKFQNYILDKRQKDKQKQQDGSRQALELRLKVGSFNRLPLINTSRRL
jgi:hypothetical protein